MTYTLVYGREVLIHRSDCRCVGRREGALRAGPNRPLPETLEAPDLTAAMATHRLTVLMQRGERVRPARCAR